LAWDGSLPFVPGVLVPIRDVISRNAEAAT
jgi:hypothetical protein